jgi:general stress protein 26
MTVNSDENRRHLHELVQGFDTAMLVTRTADGSLRARPLTVAKSKEPHDSGLVYFSTSVESPKIDELESDARVAVTFQDSKRYISLSGTARLTRDRALIDELWSEAWKVWFPKGKDDPMLAILAVTLSSGEYWDQTGLAGVRYLAAALKAYATGTKAPDGADDERNAKVSL